MSIRSTLTSNPLDQGGEGQRALAGHGANFGASGLARSLAGPRDHGRCGIDGSSETARAVDLSMLPGSRSHRCNPIAYQLFDLRGPESANAGGVIGSRSFVISEPET